jgi:hypothetical protein
LQLDLRQLRFILSKSHAISSVLNDYSDSARQSFLIVSITFSYHKLVFKISGFLLAQKLEAFSIAVKVKGNQISSAPEESHPPIRRERYTMSNYHRPHPDEVEQLLLNATLRDDLEPFFDESLQCLDTGRVPIKVENDFLTAILAWEKAPVWPISRWFDPELLLPDADQLTDNQVHDLLWDAIQQLASKRVFLDFTDHLNDRQLYCLLKRDILPSEEKMVDLPTNCLYFNCAQPDESPEIWMQYYATEEERFDWEEESGQDLPPVLNKPHPRTLPK